MDNNENLSNNENVQTNIDLNNNVENIQNNTNLNNNVENIQNNVNLNNNILNTNYNNQSQNINNNFQNDITPNKTTNSKQKKKLIFIIAIILLVIVISFICYKNFGNKSSNLNILFDDKNLILIKKDDKYGYINSNGKVALEPVYEEATNFYGNYAVVLVNVEKDGIKEKKYQLIDRKGKVKAQADYHNDIEYISDYNVWIINEQLYDINLNKLSPNNVLVDYEDYGYLTWEDIYEKSAGIMNISGKITYTYDYQPGERYFTITPSKIDSALNERYCRTIIDNEKYGIVNCDTGDVIYNYTENYISNEDDNIFEVKKREDNSLVNLMYIQNNKIIYSTSSKKVDLYYDNYFDYIRIDDDDKNEYSYININTGDISSEKPSRGVSKPNEWETLTGITTKKCDSGYGLEKDQKEILPCEWEDIGYFDIALYQYLTSKGKNYVIAEKDDKNYIINLKNGKTVVELDFDSCHIYDYSTFIYCDNYSNREKIIYNLATGKLMNIDKYDYLKIYSNYITVEKDETDKIDYYNTNLKLIYSKED